MTKADYFMTEADYFAILMNHYFSTPGNILYRGDNGKQYTPIPLPTINWWPVRRGAGAIPGVVSVGWSPRIAVAATAVLDWLLSEAERLDDNR